MPKRAARVGDPVRYVCRRGDNTYQGVGRIISGSSNITCEGRRLARNGDSANCGPCGIGRVVATARHKGNSRKIARIGDRVIIVAGAAQIIGAARKTVSN